MGRETQIAGAEIQHPVGQLESLKNRFGISGDLLMGVSRLVGMNKPVELHLVELVQADQASGVAAIAARFPAETRAVSGVAQRKLIDRNDFIAMKRGDGDFSCRRQPQIVFSTAKAFLGKFWELAGTGEAGGIDQHRRQDFAIALAGVQIQHEIDQGSLQPRSLPHQGDEAALGYPNRPFRFKQSESFCDLPMLFESRLLKRCSPATELDVVGFVLPIRTVLSGKVGIGEQLVAKLVRQLLLLLLQHGHPLFDGVALPA